MKVGCFRDGAMSIISDRVTVHAARYSSFDPDRWWETRGGVRIEIVELSRRGPGESRSRVCGDLWPGEQPAPVLPLPPIPAFEMPARRRLGLRAVSIQWGASRRGGESFRANHIPRKCGSSIQDSRCRIDAYVLARHARHDERDPTPVHRRPAGVGCAVGSRMGSPKTTDARLMAPILE